MYYLILLNRSKSILTFYYYIIILEYLQYFSHNFGIHISDTIYDTMIVVLSNIYSRHY